MSLFHKSRKAVEKDKERLTDLSQSCADLAEAAEAAVAKLPPPASVLGRLADVLRATGVLPTPGKRITQSAQDIFIKAETIKLSEICNNLHQLGNKELEAERPRQILSRLGLTPDDFAELEWLLTHIAKVSSVLGECRRWRRMYADVLADPGAAREQLEASRAALVEQARSRAAAEVARAKALVETVDQVVAPAADEADDPAADEPDPTPADAPSEGGHLPDPETIQE